jgi:hypothetical protein
VSLLRSVREAEDEREHDRSRRGSTAKTMAMKETFAADFQHFVKDSYDKEAGRISLQGIHGVYLDPPSARVDIKIA